MTNPCGCDPTFSDAPDWDKPFSFLTGRCSGRPPWNLRTTEGTVNALNDVFDNPPRQARGGRVHKTKLEAELRRQIGRAHV